MLRVSEKLRAYTLLSLTGTRVSVEVGRMTKVEGWGRGGEGEEGQEGLREDLA